MTRKASLFLASTWLVWQLLQTFCTAQSLGDLVTYTAGNLSTVGSLTRGAVNLVPNVMPSLLIFNTLPPCQSTNLLLASGGFPRNWASLSAEQQAAHPINLVIMQLAYAPYQPADALKDCFGPMGIDAKTVKGITSQVPQFQTVRNALIMRAGKERIIVSIAGSNFRGGRDLAINLACKHTKVDGKLFGAPGKDIKLHTGFWSGWQALEQGILQTVTAYLKDVPSGEVIITGHSLGGAMASIAALRLNAVLPKGKARVAGVWLFGSPRVGNVEWAKAYDAVLKSQTLRMSNYQDFAVRLPEPQQRCSLGGSIDPLTLEAYTMNDSGLFDYKHIGRAMLMCPVAQTGLTEWRIYPGGSDNVDCGVRKGAQGLSIPDEADYSGGTHVLGSYFDAWRRGYLATKRNNLASDPRVTGVMCQQCAVKPNNVLGTFSLQVNQMNVPARSSGPVTCALSEQCNKEAAFYTPAAVGRGFSVQWAGPLSWCSAYTCIQGV